MPLNCGLHVRCISLGCPPALLEADTDQLFGWPLMLQPAGMEVPSKDSCSKTMRFCAIIAVANSKANTNSKLFLIVIKYLD